MGLEQVELVMALEEAFGVELKDDEVAKTVTPRLLGDLIFSKLDATDEKTCQTQRAFYILRRGLMSILSLRRSHITPETRIRKLIPRQKERVLWPQLGAAIAARNWPKLARPLWLSRSITAGSTFLIAATIYSAIRHSRGLTIGIVGGLAVGAVFGILATQLTRPFELFIPQRFATVRELIPPVLTSDRVKWTREQVSELVKRVVLEQLALPEAKYREDASFVKDFGI